MANLLITGASGFLGTNLLRHFENNPSVKIFVNTRKKDFDSYVRIDEISAQSLQDNKIDSVLHLAGIAHDLSGKYVERDYMQVNYENTVKIFDEFKKSGANQFVFVSSIKALTDKAGEPIDENYIADPKTFYGKSKLQAERYILENQPVDKDVIILRPSMIHGKGNKGNLNLLYRFVKTGIPYPLGAFANSRSFLSVQNFMFVIEMILQNKVKSGCYNLSDDGTISTVELVKLICFKLNKTPRVWNFPQGLMRAIFSFNPKMLDKLTENMVVSNGKIKSQIGQLPVSLHEGLAQTISQFEN